MPALPTTAYIAVGANLGDRAATIACAVATLDATPGVRVTKQSSLLENSAVGGPADSPSFLNGMVEVETTLTPHDLLAALLRTERSLGRERRHKWEPRPIDLDLILFGEAFIDDNDLQIPHPLMQDRRFVLGPLAEIAPDVLHPVAELTIREMLADLDEPEELPPPVAVNGVITRETRCVGCDYDLRGLPVRHTCPECGRPTADSLDADWFDDRPPSDPYQDDPRMPQAMQIGGRCGYAPQAVLLVVDALHAVTDELVECDRQTIEYTRDAKAKDVVLAFAGVVRELFWDDDKAAVLALHRWGINGSGDVGKIVFEVVAEGWFTTSDGDRLEDFSGLFVTTALFSNVPPVEP